MPVAVDFHRQPVFFDPPFKRLDISAHTFVHCKERTSHNPRSVVDIGMKSVIAVPLPEPLKRRRVRLP